MSTAAASGDAAKTHRLGIFGGTFNPIHLGHIETVNQLVSMVALDEVRYLPAAEPPHRANPGVSAEQRLEMVRIAVADFPMMTADDRELRRDGPSYTFDTVASFQTELPDAELNLIMGLDAILGIESWYRWSDLLDMVKVIVMVRPGWMLPAQPPPWWHQRQVTLAQLHDAGAGKICITPIKPVDISSTAVRQGLTTGNAVQQWLHPGVWQYIQEHNLYEQTT